MIDPDWVVEDLDPRTWRAIGRFFRPGQYVAAAQPGEHGLFILHDGGRRLRVVDTAVGVRLDLAPAHVDSPALLAAELHARGEWDRVHVIDRRHLAHVAGTAQAEARRDLTLDAYYHLVYQLLWDGSNGYVAVPPHPGSWHGWTYGAMLELLLGLPSPCSLALCVVGEIELVLGVSGGRIVRVTTFEGLPALRIAPTVSEDFADALRDALERAIAPPAAVLVCTAAAFEAWLTAEDKPAALQQATLRGDALLRVSP